MSAKPSVLFVCVHNAGRSQMAAGFLTVLATAASTSDPPDPCRADQVNPVAVRAMAEDGIDISDAKPRKC